MVDVWRGYNSSVNALAQAAHMKQRDDQRRLQNALAMRQEKRANRADLRAENALGFNQDMARKQDARAGQIATANLSLSQAQQQIANVKLVAEKLKTGQEIMSRVHDEASYQWAVPQIEELFPDMVGKMQSNFNPESVKQGIFAGRQKLTELQKIQAELKAKMETAVEIEKIKTEGANKRYKYKVDNPVQQKTKNSTPLSEKDSIKAGITLGEMLVDLKENYSENKEQIVRDTARKLGYQLQTVKPFKDGRIWDDKPEYKLAPLQGQGEVKVNVQSYIDRYLDKK